MHTDVMQFILSNHLSSLLAYPFIGGLLGGLCGGLLGLIVFFIARAMGGYRLEIRGVVWLRVLAALLLVIAGGITGGIVGFQEGVLRGVRRVMTDGAASEKMLPQVGRAGALLMGRVYLMSPQVGGGKVNEAALRAQLTAFDQGQWELDVPDLQRRVMNMPSQAINSAINSVSQDTIVRCPELKNTTSERMLLGFLGRLGNSMLPEQLQDAGESIQDSELIHGCTTIWRDLPVEAAKHGDPQTISCSELSAYLGRRGLDALLLKPLRAFVRAHQIGAGIIFLSLLLGTVAAFTIGEAVRKRRYALKTQTTGATDVENG